MQILIVEDEPHAASHLKELIVACCSGVVFYPVLDSVAATKGFLSTKPRLDLLFLDIHLSDGEATELFDSIPPYLPVIFTTAYDHYAIKVFELNSIAYLLKPISKEKVRQAIVKLEQLRTAGNININEIKRLQNLFTVIKPYKETFLIPYRDKLLPVPIMDFAHFEIRNGVVLATRTNQPTLVMEERSLEEVAASIDPRYFFRANRQYLVNKKAIAEVSRHINGKLAIRLLHHLPTIIFVSRDKAAEFKRWMSDG